MSDKNDNTKNSLFTLLIFVSILLTLATVVLSAYIRLSLNGLGCENWPDCYGQVGAVAEYQPSDSFSDAVPDKPHGTARAFHRVVASVLGLFVILILFIAIRRRGSGGPGIMMPLVVFALTLFLSVLGYSTPSPWIPAVTMGNLLGGMAMLAALWWMGQRSVTGTTAPGPDTSRVKPWAVLGLVVITLQIALGAWTSANFAGPSCPSLGTCDGSWLPGAGWAQGFNPFRELQISDTGRVIADDSMPLIHMVHRLGAVIALVFLAWLAIRALSIGGALKSTAVAMLVFVGLQVALGIAAVWAQLPLGIVTGHNAVAALLLLAVVNLNHLVFLKQSV